MALQVWLPLNNNMNNFGLCNVSISPTASTYSDGFIEKALSCNGSTYWAISGFTLGDEVTIAYWSKTSTNSKMAWVLECTLSNYLNLYEANIYTLNSGDANNNPYKTPSNANINVLHDGKWHHFAITWGNNESKLYIDGEYKGKAQTYKSPAMSGKKIKLAGGFNNTHTYDWNGQIYDFRIYDNCITEEDIKRLYYCKTMEIVSTERNEGFFYDRSGLLLNDLAETAITYTNNSMFFNGNSGSTGSQIRPKTNGEGISISGGTLSVWFTPLSAPSDYRIIYIDSKSHMALGFYNNQDVFLVMTNYGDNDSTYKAYKAQSINYGQPNSAIIGYNSDYSPSYVYFNGVKATEQSVGVNRWYEPLNGITIGGRTYNDTSRFNGYISKVTVYKNLLTEEDAVNLYKIGPQDETLFSFEYAKLKYIQCTGTQYIDTNVVPTLNTGVYMKAAIISGRNGNNIIFGATDKNAWASGAPFAIDVRSRTIINMPHGGDPSYTGAGYYRNNVINFSNALGTVYEYELNYLNDNLGKVNTTQATLSASTKMTTKSLWIFDTNTLSGGASQFITLDAKMYDVKISENDSIIRKYVPCKRHSDSAVGLYDIVTSTFYGNNGTGTFIQGPEYRKLPKEYQQLEYVAFSSNTFVSTNLQITAGQTVLTNAQLYYKSGEKTRDLMGWSTAGNNYWGVTTGSTWEKATSDNSSIIRFSNITYQHTATSAGTYQIGALNSGHTTRNKYISYFKITIDDTCQRELVSCRRKSDSAIGFYDYVTELFYTAMNGSLSAGPDM